MTNHRTPPAIKLLAALALATFATGGCVTPSVALPAEGPAVHVDADGLALEGFDPVAYLDAGEARRGEVSFEAAHDGARYRFTSAEHRERFLADPERYTPAYGGWCAWAMAEGEGSLVSVDPRSFLIEDGRLLLFYDGWLADTRRSWKRRDGAALRERADRNWQRFTERN